MPPKGVAPPQPQAAPGQPSRFAVTSGKVDAPQRIVLYGPGGIGKTTLASVAPESVNIDVESGSKHIDLRRIEGIDDFPTLRALLQSNALDGYKTIVLDSGTKAEELAIAHTLKTVPHEKGHAVDNLEGYGFGKGMTHVYDTFLLLLSDLDLNIRRGRNVILICHDCVENVPNPAGEDWIRYEPHLQRPKSGKASIRNRVVQWADHVLYVGYDVAVSKDGKGRGGGTRTIYPVERPTHIAKSRTLTEPMPLGGVDDASIWTAIFGGAK
jgi:hypothetical protein